jgi:hypothetical protein
MYTPLTTPKNSTVRSRTKLIFVGDGPYLSTLHRLCAQLGVEAVFMRQLMGRRLGEVGGSALRCVLRLFYLGGGSSVLGFWERSGVFFDSSLIARLYFAFRVWIGWNLFHSYPAMTNEGAWVSMGRDAVSEGDQKL